jgi:hypothetical protein
MAHRQHGTEDAPTTARPRVASAADGRSGGPSGTDTVPGKSVGSARKAAKRDRALAKFERRLADARLEVDRRSRQLARANSEVAALETRRAALIDEERASAVLAVAPKAAAPKTRAGRPSARPRARRSPRPGTSGGTSG